MYYCLGEWLFHGVSQGDITKINEMIFEIKDTNTDDKD